MSDQISGSFVSKRRYLTVLFSDLVASSEIAESIEAEEFSELLESIRHIAREIVPKHGGRIVRVQGDGLVAVFGYPDTMEDGGRRACEAALEFHVAVSDRATNHITNGLPLQMHSGIHAGLVLMIDGDIERGRFDLIGEVPNTTSRLCSLAVRNEICVSEETLGPSAHFFTRSEVETVSLKGRSSPLRIFRVSGKSPMLRRYDAIASRSTVPFVGREAVLANLNSLLQRAQSGQQTALVVTGEAGIGKTRLLEEFQQSLDKNTITILHGYCENYLNAEPLQPFLQIVRGILGWRFGNTADEFEAKAASELQYLGPKPATELAPLVQALSPRRNESIAISKSAITVEAILQLITALAANKTLLLVLDDWQWADDASRRTLDLLLEQTWPMMTLIAARPTIEDEEIAMGLPTISLLPLTHADSEGAILAMLPTADPFLIQEIHVKAGGSPLFIEELCHEASVGAARNALIRHVGGAAWLNSLVASRVGRLPEPQLDLLQIAAIAGNIFPTWLLEKLTGYTDISPLFLALKKNDFVFPADQLGMLRFKHALTREAVYNTVEPKRRRAVHLQIAQSYAELATSESPHEWVEALAHHFDAAGLSEQAAEYSQLAGDKAMLATALDRSRTHYMSALRSLDALPDLTPQRKVQWCVLAQKLGMACVFDPLDMANGLALFERAVKIAQELQDVNLLARAEYWLGYMNYARGRLNIAARHCEESLIQALQTNDLRLVAQIKATLGQIWVSVGNYERALPLMNDAIEVKRKISHPGSRAAIGSAYTLARKAYMLGDCGHFADAHQCFEESLMLAGDSVHPIGASINELISAVYLWQGRWAEAQRAATLGADIALRCRSRSLTAMGRSLGFYAQWVWRQDISALQSLRETTDWIEARGGTISTSLSYGWLVEAMVDHGEVTQARHYAAQLLVQSRRLDRHGEAMGRRALARMAMAAGKFELAQNYLDKANSVAKLRTSRHEHASNLLCEAELALYAGNIPLATGLVDEASELFDRLQMTWHLNKADTFRHQIQPL